MAQHSTVLLHWEAYFPPEDIIETIKKIVFPLEFPKNSLAAALPYQALKQASSELSALGVRFGANDMSSVASDAFTESIAAKLLTNAGAHFVLLGKTLKRQRLQETNTSINQKVRHALNANLEPFVCLVETQAELEREKKPAEAIKGQLKECLEGFSEEQLGKISLVYETPVSLLEKSKIGSHDLDDAYERCYQPCVELWGSSLADTMRILCALSPYATLEQHVSVNSPWNGFYYKMLDTNPNSINHAIQNVSPLLLSLQNVKKDDLP
jgi:triosephosphate isomerase (TIM)